jgi:hypothetical protein
VIDKTSVTRWVEGYERAWRTDETSGLRGVAVQPGALGRGRPTERRRAGVITRVGRPPR